MNATTRTTGTTGPPRGQHGVFSSSDGRGGTMIGKSTTGLRGGSVLLWQLAGHVSSSRRVNLGPLRC